MGAVLEFFMPLVFNVLFYAIGRFIIPIVSFGHARAENAGEVFQFRTFICTRREGKLTFSEFATSIIGLIAAILLVIAYNLIV
ncbi:hypothetical protein SAMN05216319_2130 [Duganella sp. CF402]|uniref:hypothetical protein n=1 Tax=unclassified Duganella TaxID=2636909 RepID=UPI0008D044DE|nr:MULTISPECIES: hypothetical protein [unclassified Duganella]RZT09441.1 hypothetical protein EV582_1491 [Duganella sp. BK701]SEL57221.1 hypothetical protein SAMN05216319_2130 [Duganella sp. CF402]